MYELGLDFLVGFGERKHLMPLSVSQIGLTAAYSQAQNWRCPWRGVLLSIANLIQSLPIIWHTRSEEGYSSLESGESAGWLECTFNS